MATEQFLFVAVFEIDGIEHTMRGFADTASLAKERAEWVVDHMNATIEGQEATLRRIHFRVTREESEKLIADSSAKNPDHVTTNPLLLHKPQAEVLEINQ